MPLILIGTLSTNSPDANAAQCLNVNLRGLLFALVVFYQREKISRYAVIQIGFVGTNQLHRPLDAILRWRSCEAMRFEWQNNERGLSIKSIDAHSRVGDSHESQKTRLLPLIHRRA